ncbi:MAG: hypothetical protein II852_18660 [Bacteroidales bacterium]|nr:hypothetical protein [Bacteroidales bacterium]
MKPSIQILISALVIIAATATQALAQIDTLPDLPLYKNVAADTDEGAEGGVNYAVPQTKDTIDAQLRSFQNLYSAGKYHAALKLSQEIQDKYDLQKPEKLILLKYAIAAYNDLDYDNEADRFAKDYLQKDPFYDPEKHTDDPISFRKVLDNYYTKPKFSVWAAIGRIGVEPYMDTIRSIIDTTSRTPEYDIKGYEVQLGFEYRPFKIFSISIAPSVHTYDLARTISRTDIATFHCNESSLMFTLPILVEAGLYRKREIFVPSIYAGAQMKYVFNSEYKAYTLAPGIYTEIPEYKDNADLKTKFNYSILGGVRLNFNHRRMTYFADMGISLDMLPFNDPEKIFSNSDLLYQNFYVPDVYRMIEYSVKLGIKVNLQYKTIAKYKNYDY